MVGHDAVATNHAPRMLLDAFEGCQAFRFLQMESPECKGPLRLLGSGTILKAELMC